MYKQIIKAVSSLKGIWATFEHYKNKARLLVLMLIITSFLEAFSIGMLLPVLEIIVSGEAESTFGMLVTQFMNGADKKDQLIIILYIFFGFVVLMFNDFSQVWLSIACAS